jgi:hypothetical protein
MIFKRHRGQIFDVELSSKEQKAMEKKINQQILEQHRKFSDDFDYMILSVLHRHFGFGPVRLRRAYDLFRADYEGLKKRYEMAEAGVYIARKEMNELGCNVERWNKERSE